MIKAHCVGLPTSECLGGPGPSYSSTADTPIFFPGISKNQEPQPTTTANYQAQKQADKTRTYRI